MNYTFSEARYLQTSNGGTELLKALGSVELDQLRMALKPHVEVFKGNVETFENCFFPVYPNNEGGIEYVRFYHVFNEKKVHVFDFVRIESSAGVFFETGTLKEYLVLWAGKIVEGSPQRAETAHLLKAWEMLYM